MQDNGKFILNRENQICYKKTENTYLITDRDWKRIRKAVSNFHPYKAGWLNATWAVLGILGSSFISWLTTITENNKAGNQVLLTICGASVIIIILCLIAHYSIKKEKGNSFEQIKDTLTEIEETIIPKI